MTDPELTLDLPWVRQEPERLDGLTIRRGRPNTLSYDDGITLEVHVVDPRSHRSIDGLLAAIARDRGAGRVMLVAGTSLSSASRAIAQLAAQGLVEKEREGRDVLVSVIDRVALADLLA